jgi:hypothetical protein
MTQVVRASTGVGALAQSLIGTRRQVAGLASQGTNYIIDPASGNAVVIIGDCTQAPMNTFTASPSSVPTWTTSDHSTGAPALTGWGLAIYNSGTGTWTKLNS